MPIFAPAWRTAATSALSGMPQENCTIGAPASRAAGSDRGSLARTKFTKKGLLIAERTFVTRAEASSGENIHNAIPPIAPALETVMARSGLEVLPVAA